MLYADPARKTMPSDVGGAVDENFGVERLLPERIAAQSGDLLRESAVDQRCGGRRVRERRRRKRKAERGVLFQRSCTVGLLLQREPVNQFGLGGIRGS